MVTPYIRQQLSSGLVRLRVTPDEPAEGPPAITEAPPRGSGRPHSDMTVAKVRHLIENTALAYREISAKTGVGVEHLLDEIVRQMKSPVGDADAPAAGELLAACA